MGDDGGTVSVKAQEVLLFWDAAFFRARYSRWYSRCFLFISSICSLNISPRRIRCCMFLSSLFREASSKVGVWIYIGNQEDTPKVLYIHNESIPAMLVISLSASHASFGVDIAKYQRGSSAGRSGGQK